MRFLLALLLLLALPATAHAKGAHDLRVEWRSMPDGLRAGETWVAEFAFPAPRGGLLLLDNVRPVVRLSSDVRELRVPARMRRDGVWTAHVRIPPPGRYQISLEGWDPRDPHRFSAMEPPLVVAAAPAPRAARSQAPPWALLALVPAALAVLLTRRRVRRAAPALSRR